MEEKITVDIRGEIKEVSALELAYYRIQLLREALLTVFYSCNMDVINKTAEISLNEDSKRHPIGKLSTISKLV